MRLHTNPSSSPLASEPRGNVGESGELPLSDDTREALIASVEAWIEGEERLIAEIERRVEEVAQAALPFKPRSARVIVASEEVNG
jgi:hypothetical protein